MHPRKNHDRTTTTTQHVCSGDGQISMASGLTDVFQHVLRNVWDGHCGWAGKVNDRGTIVAAWDYVMAGRIPILWTQSAAEVGVKKDGYDSFLRWYGKWSPEALQGTSARGSE